MDAIQNIEEVSTPASSEFKLEEHKVEDLYSGVRGLAVKILNRVERTDAYLEKLLEVELRRTELSGNDKALLYEIVHGVIRWMGRLDWILAGFYKGQFSKAIPTMKNAQRIALYQILFLDKIPEYAAVNEAVEFVKKLQGQKPADITNAVLRNIIRSKNQLRYPDPAENLIGYLSTYYSHPAWLIKRWLSRFGREETEKLLLANNERPYLTLRANQLKVSLDEFKSLMNSVNLKYNDGIYLKEFFKLQNLANVINWQYFQEGYFSIQDESTGLACRLLDVQPGMRVLDMCAAPGGKAAYLADLMNNKGELVVIDKFEARLEVMNKNLSRLGVTIHKAVYSDALDFNDEEFDRVLADVPCSGLGTLSKKPDIKWKKELIDIHQMRDYQLQLLKKAASLVKKNGVVVYSTCSIEPEENIQVVHNFLTEFKNFKLVPAGENIPQAVVNENNCIQTLPHKHKSDGAFAAKLLRVN